MLISYPVLPEAAIQDDEDAYLAAIMRTHVLDDEGRYPISTLTTPAGPIHRWHGGIHMTGIGEAIRAIADGTVVAYRFARACEAYGSLGNYDTSFVLLRHDTETGENTRVVFYSLYMHLANRNDLAADRFVQLPTWLRQYHPGPEVQVPRDLRVWRKDVLGFSGQLYGRQAWHFEIFTTAEALEAFWRDSDAVRQGAGSADVYGDVHFVVPTQQAFAERHPRAAAGGNHAIQFPGNANHELPVGQVGQNQHQLYVSVKLQGGRRTATSYRRLPDGSHEQIGQPVVQENYEYDLYRLATALYPDCPSAGLEWLRLGRVLGSENTSRVENWQLVRYNDNSAGYINLAAPNIIKLSDADFPRWHGWQRCDEGERASAADGLCDDEATIALSVSRDERSNLRVRHLVVRHPSEWDAADLGARYARLRAPGQPLETDASWQRFVEHVERMAFWNSTDLPRSVWYFHPLQFIRHFRQCGWLSASEFKQLQPSHAIRGGRLAVWERVPPISMRADSIGARHRIPINTMMRKYGVSTPKRKATFFGNALQEVSWLQSLSEGNGAAAWYAPWYGRGFLQLTNPDNYCGYWTWRGRTVSTDLNTALNAAYNSIANTTPASARTNAALQDQRFPALTRQMIAWRDSTAGVPEPPVGEALLAPSDSAGFYWIKNSMMKYADQPHRLERCTVQANRQAKIYYRSEAFWRASAAVNLPGAINTLYSPHLNGFDSRCCAYGVALAVLSECRFPNEQSASSLWYPEGYEPRRVNE